MMMMIIKVNSFLGSIGFTGFSNHWTLREHALALAR